MTTMYKVKVYPESNPVTRTLRVLIGGDVNLDIRLDENEYSYDFEVAHGREFRVELKNSGAALADVVTLPAHTKHQDVVKEKFAIFCDMEQNQVEFIDEQATPSQEEFEKLAEKYPIPEKERYDEDEG